MKDVSKYLKKGERRYINKELEIKEKLDFISGYKRCRVTKIMDTGELKVRVAFDGIAQRTEEENKFLFDISKQVTTLDGDYIYHLDIENGALASLGVEQPVDNPRRPITKFVKDELKLNRRLSDLTGFSGCQIYEFQDTGELRILLKFDAGTVHTDAENELLSKIMESKVARPDKPTVYILNTDKALAELKMSRPKRDI